MASKQEKGGLRNHRRARTAARWIHAEDKRVADIGCGAQILKQYLPAHVSYIGVDNNSFVGSDSQEGVHGELLVDFDHRPDLDLLKDTDVGFIMGVLVFLADWREFLDHLHQQRIKRYVISTSARNEPALMAHLDSLGYSLLEQTKIEGAPTILNHLRRRQA